MDPFLPLQVYIIIKILSRIYVGTQRRNEWCTQSAFSLSCFHFLGHVLIGDSTYFEIAFPVGNFVELIVLAIILQDDQPTLLDLNVPFQDSDDVLWQHPRVILQWGQHDLIGKYSPCSERRKLLFVPGDFYALVRNAI